MLHMSISTCNVQQENSPQWFLPTKKYPKMAENNYTWSPEQQKSNIFPSVSPAPEPGAHFRPGTMSRAQPFRWAIFLCGDNSTAFGNKRAPTHTQTSLNIISKNISQIQDIHAFLRWQNRNHPIWRISAVEPSLVDVSNAYLYSVSAWKMHPLLNISGWKIYKPPEPVFRLVEVKAKRHQKRGTQSNTHVFIYLHHGWTSGAIIQPWAITGKEALRYIIEPVNSCVNPFRFPLAKS